MHDVIERRQVIPIVRVAQVRRLAQHDSPRRHPLPEFVLGVALQSPLLRFTTVMDKECGQHIGIFHHAQKLGVVSQFHEIVGGRSGSSSKSERNLLTCVNQFRAVVAIRVFQDAGFVQNNTAKSRKIKVIQLLIICDISAGAAIRLHGHNARVDAKFLGLARHLV